MWMERWLGSYRDEQKHSTGIFKQLHCVSTFFLPLKKAKALDKLLLAESM